MERFLRVVARNRSPSDGCSTETCHRILDLEHWESMVSFAEFLTAAVAVPWLFLAKPRSPTARLVIEEYHRRTRHFHLRWMVRDAASSRASEAPS